MGPGRESEQEPAGRGKPLSLVSMDKLREALSRMVCDLLKVQMEEIDVEMELSEYGFDSITLKLFANRLNQSYQLDLTPAHFYEYSTIERLALYLQRTSAAILTSHFVATFTVTPEVPQKDQRQGRGPVAAPT
ncbi:MAG: acyl carrier protein, partial [Chloroflexi bacterium]